MSAVRSRSVSRTIAINIAVLIVLLLAIEVIARLFVMMTRGTATAGLRERTLNLEYEPFVMYGPGWDARFAAVPRDELPTVLLVGGSTAEGFAPEILEAAVGRRFGYEEANARQVTRFAEIIFDALAQSESLTRHQRTLLSAAALLHDAGYHIAHEEHHKHSLYLIKHSELTGFSEAERSVVANVARYHRGAPPRERHPDYAALGEQDRETVCRLAAVLRLADALDRSYDSRVRDLKLTRDGTSARLFLLSPLDCAREISAAEQKRDLFEQVFGCRLESTGEGLGAGG